MIASMQPRLSLPCWLTLIALAVPVSSLRAADDALRSQSRGHYATQLATECDALLDSAVRRPYGIGWSRAATGDDGKHNVAQPVAMGTGATPAAGLVLELAAQVLDEPKYHAAAIEVARGIASAQNAATTGKVPDEP